MRVEVHNTAAEVLTQAVQKFQVVAGALPGAEKDYRLVEVCSDGGTAVHGRPAADGPRLTALPSGENGPVG